METINLDHHTTYSLVRCLGEGGMGAVYEAIQHGADGFTKRVAIKLIHPWVTEKRPEFLQNFVGEAKLVAQLIHTSIVQTYQLGRCERGPFIAMEYIPGIDLLQFMEIHGTREIPIPIPIAVFIASRICRGLSYAHSKCDDTGQPLGIVHRDISPQNILIAREGDVKITDFGMAKALNLMLDGEGEVIMGKMRYMAPEQAEGKKTDARSDIFSAGVVLSELLTGFNIFAAEDSIMERKLILEHTIPDFREVCPELDETLAGILAKSVARDPDQRYPNAKAMLFDLEKYIYSGGYGPTLETLADYVKDFIQQPVERPDTAKTQIMNHPQQQQEP